MIIEVCGPGCPRCHATNENVRKALKEMELEEGKEIEVTEIKDPKIMAARGVFMTPAVLIEGVKLCEGRIPNKEEIKKWIEERK
ncbi:MAG: thioredoxin family protein [Dehalococcoidia bacterium]|jgi:small redox-active disulfide protein 2